MRPRDALLGPCVDVTAVETRMAPFRTAARRIAREGWFYHELAELGLPTRGTVH